MFARHRARPRPARGRPPGWTTQRHGRNPTVDQLDARTGHGVAHGDEIAPKTPGRASVDAVRTITDGDVRWSGHPPDGWGSRLYSGSPTVTADRIVAAWQP